MDDGRRPWPPPCFTVNDNMKRPRFSPLTTPAHFCPAFHLTLYAFLILNAPSYFWLMFIVTAGYGYGHYLLIISD